ncbi:MAG TPA: MFS transporter [Kofleriaceae bacterium]|nr:MFS transporter [Kofleriaceae bacterium]
MSTGGHRNVFLGIVLAQVLDSIAVAILLPAIPFLALRLGAAPVTVAAVMSVQFVGGALGSPVLGWLSDRIPRPAILLGSLVAACASSWLLTIAHSIALLFVLRTITGFMSSNLVLLESMIAEMTTIDERGPGIAKLRLGSTIGLILGPGAAGLLGRLDLGDGLVPMIVLAAAIQTFEPLVLARALRGRWVTRHVGVATPTARGGVFHRFVTTAKIRDYALIKALIATCFALVMAISPVWSADRLGWTATDLSGLVFGFGVSLFVVQIVVAANRLPWLTSSRALFVACAIVAVGFGVVIAFPHGAALVVCCVALGLSSAVVNIVVPTTISRIALLDVGAMLGITSTAVLAGSSLGPLAFGGIYERLGGGWVWSGGLALALVATVLAGRHADRATRSAVNHDSAFS